MQHAHRTGAIDYPSGWVGDCPFGEYRSGAPRHNVGGMNENSEPENGAAAEQLISETLVEEVMIDGMCGVY